MATGTTTTINWAWGTNTVLSFNPATDLLDFGWFQGEQFTLTEVNGSVVISIPSNNQTYTLTGVTLAALSLANISAKDSSAAAKWDTALAAADGASGGSSGGGGSTETGGGNTDTGGGTGGSGGSTDGGNSHVGDGVKTVTTITWAWGTNTVLNFDTALDVLDFGWFSADNFTISEVNGSVVVAIPTNNQTYTLSGVSLAGLTLANISAKDVSALAEWQAAIDSAGGTGGGETGGGETGGGETGGGETGGGETGGGETGGGETGGGETGGGGTGGGGTGADYAAAWSGTTVYFAGDQVSIGNLVYEANWWTRGDDPSTHSGVEGSGNVWTFVGYMDTTPVVPDAPDDLRATGVSDDSLTLRWDAAEVDGVGTVSGYQIYQDGELIGTTTSTYFKVSGLDASTAYSFSIVAVDEAGSSQASELLSVTTDATDTSPAGDKSFSPYVDMSLTTSQDLVHMVEDAGLEAVTLAFVLTSGTNTIGWGGIGTIENDTLSNGTSISSIIQELQANGVDVTISFGGANGQEAASTFSSVAALVSAYQSIIDTYGVTKLDFDIEGAAIADTEANSMRNEALAILQHNNPGLEVSYTLPVLTDGLTAAGVALLQDAVAHGVEVSYVNIMAMDYGAYYDSGDMGDDAISAAEATLDQLHTIGLDTKLVITPMIGINDVTTEVFTLEDAHQLVDYAQSNDEIAGISMWSLSRDNGDVVGYVSPVGSGIAQTDYGFSEIFGHI